MATPTSAAIQAAVQQMVNAATGPIKQAQGTFDKNAQQQQTNVTGLSSALAGILGGIGPGVEQTYSDASQRQAAFARGFSDHMQEQLGQNASNTSSFLQNIVGAPTSQVQQVAGQVAPAGAADTLYGIQGYIPASTLNQEGAAYTANAKQLPAIAQSQGLQQIGKIQAAQAAKDAEFAQQIGTAAGKAPEYTRQLTNDAFNQAYKTHEAGIADAKLTLQQKVDDFNTKYKIASLDLRGQTLKLQASKFARQTLQSDRSYAVVLAGLGLRQAAAQRAALAAEYKLKNGGFTPKQIADYNGFLQAGLDTLPKGTTYAQYIAKAVEHKVPLSLAIDRANAHWADPLQRGTAKSLSDMFGISTSDATSAAGLPTASDYNKMVGAGAGAGFDIATAAAKYLGVPYKWGGNNPKTGLDCSSFIQQTFKQIGVNLPRTTYAQVKVGAPVDLASLQPGDAIFTRPGKRGPQHVGLYIGNGQVQESPHTGDVNKIIDLKSYLSDGFVAARRYVGNG